MEAPAYNIHTGEPAEILHTDDEDKPFKVKFRDEILELTEEEYKQEFAVF